ncbi:hypothetical protein ACFQWF_01745 [Methylorubrum suomiense]
MRARGLTLIEKSQWAHGRISIGQILTKGEVNDEATDAEWLETLDAVDGDEALALASFLDRFPLDAESARKPEPPAKPPQSAQVQHNASAKKGRQASPATS